jgi:hypothetical protein
MQQDRTYISPIPYLIMQKIIKDNFTNMLSGYLDKKHGGKLLRYEDVVSSVNEASGASNLGLAFYLKIYNIYLRTARVNC